MAYPNDIEDFNTGHDYNEQYEYQELEDDERDAAWEEYMSTGIDPTGGELGPNFDPASGRLLSEMEDSQEERETEYEPVPGGTLVDNLDRLEAVVDARLAELKRIEAQKAAAIKPKPKAKANQPQQPFNWHTLFLVTAIIFFGICIISGLEKKAQEKVRIEQQARDQEWAERQAEQRRQREAEARMNEHVKTPEEIEAEKQATREEVQRLLNGGRTVAPAPVKSTLPQRGTAYGDGYWDGYEEGFDDADGHNSYGFKYDESTGKYTGKALAEYVCGYRKGYKEGWDEGIEQLQDRYDNGDDELDEGEY